MGETPKTALLHRINNIFGKTEISRRFRLKGESDGWADLFIGSPLERSRA
ncbi:hypothetical protein [Nostoc sp. FACHB-888]|jgi:hypothetical protein|nr:hypothetical protein [Nostoc sp. FACHB-888]MBD2249277.1 hypothetical protein [Nostoc sp. FACHB-888]